MIFIQKVVIFFLGVGLIQGSVQAGPELSLPIIPAGESAALPDDLIEQAEIESGNHKLFEIRRAGAWVFTAPFNRYDGMGDGPP